MAANNTGTIDVASSALTFGQAVSGAGTFVLNGDATLDFANVVGTGSTLQFLHSGGTLEAQTLGTFGATIAGFASGDTIDAASVGFVTGTTTVGFSNGTLTVSNATQSASFVLTGSYVASSFQVSADGHGGTAVVYV